MKTGIESFIVRQDQTLRDAVRAMDNGGIGFVAVISKDDRVVGVLTDGDFRRAMLQGKSLEEPVVNVANHRFVHVSADTDRQSVRELFESKRIRHIPVLEDGRLVDLIHEDEFLLGEPIHPRGRGQLRSEVVVMAGGKGTRLEPFTKILPKPLIPVGERTMLEVVLDRFKHYGVGKFHVSVNHMAHMIKAYFEDKGDSYALSYLEETEPRGTCGSLSALRGKMSTPFFVTNCDVIIIADYEAIYDFHVKNNSAITMVASMKHIRIPYGVCTIKEGGELEKIVEKPHYDVMVNTGMYILSPEMLELIPEAGKFDMTDLIQTARVGGHKVHVFPVRETSWLDVGEWDEYRKTVRQLLGTSIPGGI